MEATEEEEDVRPNCVRETRRKAERKKTIKKTRRKANNLQTNRPSLNGPREKEDQRAGHERLEEENGSKERPPLHWRRTRGRTRC